MGVFARAFRRAGLPVRMSEGFNPRPRFSLPVPLPVGVAGFDEVIELDLSEELEPEALARRLSEELPNDIEISRAELLEPGTRARVSTVRYRVLGELPAGCIERCIASKELRATRRNGKEIDIRPYIKEIGRCDGGCEFELFVSNEGTARPAEVVAALCNGDVELSKHLSTVRTAVNLDVP